MRLLLTPYVCDHGWQHISIILPALYQGSIVRLHGKTLLVSSSLCSNGGRLM